MRTLFRFLIAAFLWPAATATAQSFPLQSVPADSVEIEGFFWRDQLKYAREQRPELQPEPLFLDTKDLRRVPSLTKQWEKAMSKASLEGINGGNVKSTSQFVELCYRLARLTGDGRYSSAAEHMLVNTLCQEDDPKATSTLLNLQENIYTTSGDHLYVNYPIRSQAHIVTPSLDLQLQCVTSSPWFNDRYILWFNFNGPQRHMTLHLRLPSWMDTDTLTTFRSDRQPKLRPTKTADALILDHHIENGYLVIDKEWCDSDYVGVQINTPIYRVSDTTQPGLVAFQKGSVLYRMLELPDGMRVNPQEAVHSEFDADRHTNVLSGPYYDAKGQPAGRFSAEPYLFHRKKGPGGIFLPSLSSPAGN